MRNEFEHHDYYDEHPLDFEKIESGELFLDVFARSRIHRLYLEFRSAAEMYNSAPPLDAMAARSKARTINKKATAAKPPPTGSRGVWRSSAKADWGCRHGSTLKSASSSRSISC